MKLIACVLLAVLAVAVGDEGFYQQQVFSSAPADTYSNYNSYYDNQRPAKQQGFASRLWNQLFEDNRRQGPGDIVGLVTGGGPVTILVIFAGVLLVIFVGATAFSAFTQFAGSGRGLASDDWEINHSVWMNQLQKDFEDSWTLE